jgi:flagella basal body P-ring formation protein FlgA
LDACIGIQKVIWPGLCKQHACRDGCRIFDPHSSIQAAKVVNRKVFMFTAHLFRLVCRCGLLSAVVLLCASWPLKGLTQQGWHATSSAREFRPPSAPGAQATTHANDRASAARENLRDEARAWIAERTGSALEAIEIGALDTRVDPSTCDQGYTFDFPFQSRSTVRARCDHPARQLYLRVGVQTMEARVTVNRNLPAGHVVTPADVSTRVGRQQGGGLSNPSMAIGRALTRPITAGEFLDIRDLDEVITVLRSIVPLGAGDRASSGILRPETIARRQAPPGAISASDAINLSLRRAIPAGHILTQDDLVDARTVLVARRTLMRGEKIDASMFEVVERDRRQIPPDHLQSSEGLANAELIAPIQAGETLRTSQFRRSTVVRKGQLVVLTVNQSGIEISVRVEAMEDARVGEQLRLRNPDSGKTLAGVATGQGTARAL